MLSSTRIKMQHHHENRSVKAQVIPKARAARWAPLGLGAGGCTFTYPIWVAIANPSETVEVAFLFVSGYYRKICFNWGLGGFGVFFCLF